MASRNAEMSRCIPSGISWKVPLFPPAPVAVSIDGRPVAAYVRAYLAGGRVFAPAAPLLTLLADRIWFDGDTLVAQRGQRRVRIRLTPGSSGQLGGTYIAAGPALRALGATVHYEPGTHRLFVSTSARVVVASPTPFNPAVPSVAPSAIFTPTPTATPRPIWTGSPLPGRTPLPLSQPPRRASATRRE